LFEGGEQDGDRALGRVENWEGGALGGVEHWEGWRLGRVEHWEGWSSGRGGALGTVEH